MQTKAFIKYILIAKRIFYKKTLQEILKNLSNTLSSNILNKNHLKRVYV
jgi:hypothetical protein